MTIPMPEYVERDPEVERRRLLDVLAPLGAQSVEITAPYSAHVHFYAGYEKNQFLFEGEFSVNGYRLTGEFPPLPTFREDVKRHPIVAVLSVFVFIFLFAILGYTFWMSSVVFTLNQILVCLAALAVMGLLMFGVTHWTAKGQREQRIDYRRMN